MKFEDTKVGKIYLVRSSNGNEFKVYRSKTQNYFILEEDCSTIFHPSSVTIIKEIK